jgi:hypothetical protein
VPASSGDAITLRIPLDPPGQLLLVVAARRRTAPEPAQLAALHDVVETHEEALLHVDDREPAYGQPSSAAVDYRSAQEAP